MVLQITGVFFVEARNLDAADNEDFAAERLGGIEEASAQCLPAIMKKGVLLSAVGLMGTSPVPAYSRWLSRLDSGEGRIADISVDQALEAVRTRFTQEGWANRDIPAA